MRHRFLTLTAITALMTGGLMTGVMAHAQAAGQTAAPAAPASGSSKSVDDIVCQMSDTCGASAQPSDTAHQKIGDEKMFSLQKAEPAPTPAGQKVGDEKMFSLQKTDPTPAGPKVGGEKMFSLQTTPDSTPAASTGQPSYYKAGTTKASKSKHGKHPATTLADAQTGPVHEVTMQVHFDTGSADLSDDTKVELGKYVEALKRPELADMKFAIEGHTDSSGKRAINLDLSQRRAQSVVDYLVSNGVSADRLTAKGYGPDKPLAGVSRKSALNRRVELVRVD